MAELTSINPADVPVPVTNTYAQGLSVTGATQMLFVSGQIPETPDGDIPDEFTAQCRLVWTNLVTTVRAAGMDVPNLVKVTTYLTDRGDAKTNRDVRVEFLGDHRPASTVVVVDTLDPRWLLEIEGIAVR